MRPHSNNQLLLRYRRMAIVTASLALVLIVVLVSGIFKSEEKYRQAAANYDQIKSERDGLVEKEEERLLASSDEIDVNLLSAEIEDSVNYERSNHRLANLEYSEALERSACAKAKDMIDNDYWDHVSPDGVQPWNFIQDEGLTYRRAGENLARGFRDSQSVVEGWMNSQSHRQNILSKDYTHQGICVYKYFQYQQDSYRGAIVVQHLMKP